jgi:ribonuclease HI/quercetin dioxygenase-like cupin family protein
LSRVVIHSDGGARGNPGPAAIGVVLEAERDGSREVIAEIGERIGVATNNVAEYRALIRGLEEARRLGATEVTCLLDSQLVVEQMNGRYKVRHGNIVELHRQATELARELARVTFAYVPRAQNAEADRLVNAALDGKPVGELSARQAGVGESGPQPRPPAFTSQPRYQPLGREGATGVEARVLVEEPAVRAVLLRFAPHAQVDEHSAEQDHHVACVEGDGWVSVGGERWPITEGQHLPWPRGVPHHAWTEDSAMVLLVITAAR